MRKYGKTEKLNKFYENLAKLNLGRQITFYAQKIMLHTQIKLKKMVT